MSENTNIVKYGEYTPEAAQQDLDENKRRARTPFVKFPEGDTSVRVLPPPLNKRSPFQKIVAHKLDTDAVVIFLEMNDEQAAQYEDARKDHDYPVQVVCPREHGGQNCTICKWAFELYANGKKNKNKADKELGYQALPKTQYFVNVIVRGEEDKGPQVWRMSGRMMEDLAAMAKNPKIGNYSNPGDRGFDLIVTRKGTGPMDTRYSIAASRMNEPLSDDVVLSDKWITEQHDLSQLVVLNSLEDQVERILEWGNKDEEEQAAPKGRQPKTTAQDDIEDGEVMP